MKLLSRLWRNLWLCLLCWSSCFFWSPLAGATACAPEIIATAIARDISPADHSIPPLTPPNLAAAEWQTVSLPHTWLDLWPEYEGYAWYRIDWQCAQGEQPASVAMMAESVVLAGAIYLNNDLLWRDRNLVEPVTRSWATPRYLLFPQSSMQPGVNQLWVYVYGAAQVRAGLGMVQLGAPEAMLSAYDDRWQVQRLALHVNLIISTLLGLLALLVWLYKRSQTLFGWYALLAFSWLLFGLCVVATETAPFRNTLVFAQISTLTYSLLTVSFCLFLWAVIDLKISRYVKYALGVTYSLLAVFMLWDDNWSSAQLFSNIFTLVFALACLHVLVGTLFHPTRTNKIVAACLLLIVVMVVRDYLALNGVINSRTFYTHYMCFFLMIAAAIFLASRVAANARRIERFNHELQDAVTKACSELEETLASQHSLALTNSRLQERLQLAHELHDGLGGQITRSITLLEQQREAMGSERMLSLLKILRNDLRQVIDNGTSATAAVPATPLAWAAPVRHRFVNLFDELGITSQWHIPEHWPTHPPGAAQCLALTRLLEESLTNVIKHSRANEVEVRLDFLSPSQLQFTLTDNGVGFDVNLIQSTSAGIGMRSMRERMLRQHGTLTVESKPGRTCLIARIEIKNT